MTHTINIEIENAYKQFQMNVPIFQNMQPISIRRLFKTLTSTEIKDLSTTDAMNFYLYCNFFKNRLLYSPIFKQNLNYVNLKSVELKQRIKLSVEKFEQILKDTKSESDSTWIADNINTLNDGLVMLGTVIHRCDYYDNLVALCVSKNEPHMPNLLAIEKECIVDFTRLSNLSVEVGRLIGRE